MLYIDKFENPCMEESFVIMIIVHVSNLYDI